MVTLAPKDRDLPILQKAAPEWRQQIVDVAGGLFVMLCHPQRRGGGDIPANAEEMGGIDGERGRHAKLFKGVEDVKGRWRGSHILGTSEICQSARKRDPDLAANWDPYQRLRRSSPESMEGTRARRAVPSRATERRAWGGAVGPRGRSARLGR